MVNLIVVYIVYPTNAGPTFASNGDLESAKRDPKTAPEGTTQKKGASAPRVMRNFAQRVSKPDATTDAGAPQLADDVLMQIGGSKKKQRVVWSC